MLTFYSHVLSLSHIPQLHNSPPLLPLFGLLLFLPSFPPASLLRQPKWCDAKRREQRGRRDEGGGRGRRVGKLSEGEGRKFPELPLSSPSWPLLFSFHSTLPLSTFTFTGGLILPQTIDLEDFVTKSSICHSLEHILLVFLVCLENPCYSQEGLRGVCH